MDSKTKVSLLLMVLLLVSLLGIGGQAAQKDPVGQTIVERQSVDYSAAASSALLDKINIVADGSDKAIITLRLRDAAGNRITDIYDLGTNDIWIKSSRDVDYVIATDFHGSYSLDPVKLNSADGVSLFSAKGSPIVPDEQGEIILEVSSNSVGETQIQFYKVDMLIGSNILVFEPPIIEGGVIINNRTMVPLAGIFEALGAETLWDEETDTITIDRNGTTIVLVQLPQFKIIPSQ